MILCLSEVMKPLPYQRLVAKSETQDPTLKKLTSGKISQLQCFYADNLSMAHELLMYIHYTHMIPYSGLYVQGKLRKMSHL